MLLTAVDYLDTEVEARDLPTVNRLKKRVKVLVEYEHIKHVKLKGPVSLIHGGRGSLTIDGRSQHLSLLVQPKLQTISNIWSWNCGEETKKKEKENMETVLWYMCLWYALHGSQKTNRKTAQPRPSSPGKDRKRFILQPCWRLNVERRSTAEYCTFPLMCSLMKIRPWFCKAPSQLTADVIQRLWNTDISSASNVFWSYKWKLQSYHTGSGTTSG